MLMTRRERGGETTHLLEINLISAQGLKPPPATLRRMRTYAAAWVDSDNKLRTRIDKVGGENPTWNDRFFFKVTSAFLATETSGVTVEIYALGCVRDSLVGSVRFLLNNFLQVEAKTPSFTALQIRRPSGRFQGVLNVGAMVVDGPDMALALNDVSAIGYRDLMGKGESFRRRCQKENSFNERAIRKHSSPATATPKPKANSFNERGLQKKHSSPAAKALSFNDRFAPAMSCDGGSGRSPPTASAPATPLSALMELNGKNRDLAGNSNNGKGLMRRVPLPPPTDGSRFMCCLLGADGSHNTER